MENPPFLMQFTRKDGDLPWQTVSLQEDHISSDVFFTWPRMAAKLTTMNKAGKSPEGLVIDWKMYPP